MVALLVLAPFTEWSERGHLLLLCEVWPGEEHIKLPASTEWLGIMDLPPRLILSEGAKLRKAQSSPANEALSRI